MGIKRVKFNAKDNPEFFKKLRENVNNYFKENEISKYANVRMKIKTAFMIGLYFFPMIMMYSGTVTSFSMVTLMWALMGMGMAGIGFSVMHDANHGSYSRNKKVNQALGLLLNIMGGYHINWKIQHNVLHHSFTNIHEMDEDIITPIMRFSPNQKRKRIYKYQSFYAPFFYSIMTLYWLTAKDYEQLFRYEKKDLLKGQGLTLKKAVRHLTLYKIAYFILTLVVPLMIIPLPYWQIIMGFVIMHLICGTSLAFIFQPAHVIESTKFYKADSTGSVENNWAIHQMRTTANFADKSTFFSWFIGGLNYQIEHHLFPDICHIHYKDISKIVKKTAQEFNIPYIQHRTFFDAIKSHFVLLHQLGTGKYDLLHS